MLGAYLTTAFVVGGVGAWHLLKGHWDGASQRMFSMAMWMAALVAPLQAIAGDFHGLNTLEHQPAKIAAMEGHFETHAGAPLYLFGLPDLEAETTRYAIGIPKLGSLILGHSWDAELKGLKAFPRDQWPNAPVIFWTFRLMVGIGFLMIGIGLVSLWLRWHKRLYDAQWFLRLCVLASPLGFFAVTFGWITTEHGRQPWVVYGLMRTADAVSPHPGRQRARLAGHVRGGLLRRVRRRHLLSPAPHARGPECRARHAVLARRPAADGGCRRAARARRLRTGAGGVTAMTLDLPLIWAGIIALGVIMYVIMDGFDLGVGILFPFAATDEDRDVMMNTAAPIWDGNETWLVLGGAAMLGAFPIAYAVILSAFYLPLIVMLLALIFRGVAFEFRFKSRRNRHWWDRAFAWGSMTATFAQGVVLGAFIHGIEVTDRAFQGDAFAWLTPFSLFCGLALRRRLRHAGCGLADHEDHGRPAELGLRPHALRGPPGPGRHRDRLALDPSDPRRDRGALVHLAQHPLSLARAHLGRRWPSSASASPSTAARSAPPSSSPSSSSSSPTPASPSASSPTSSPPPSRSGTPPPRTPPRPSCWSAPRSCCRSSSPTRATTTGCSAGR